MRFADLHLHTVFSDGTSSPQELIRESQKAGLSAIAVVDHDTIDGIAPTLKAAATGDIEVLPGIELSAEYEGLEIHILGYLIDYGHQDLLAKIAVIKNNRIERIYAILDKLKPLGVNLDPKIVFDIAKQGTVGRLHIAKALVREGKVGSIFEAFGKYLGDKSPAFCLGFRFSPAEAIKLIKASGGIPVLAHPYVLHNDDLILKFIDYGLMGLEVYYPEHSQSMINFYLNLAKAHDLLVTGGSDFHGTSKPEVKVGCIKMPYGLVEKLKAAKEKLLFE